MWRRWSLWKAGIRLAAMSRLQDYQIAPDKFLTLATNVLYQAILEAPRTTAKNIFKAIDEGKRVALVDVRMEDSGDVRFELALDHSEYRGERLNFGFFRNSLTALVGSLGEKLRQESAVPVFTEQTDGSLLFGVPGVTQDEAGQLNVLMLGADLQAGAGSALLKLQFMDPAQFVENVETAQKEGQQT
jgi:hypothetical protein